jgi:hypothetical protein
LQPARVIFVSEIPVLELKLFVPLLHFLNDFPLSYDDLPEFIVAFVLVWELCVHLYLSLYANKPLSPSSTHIPNVRAEFVFTMTIHAFGSRETTAIPKEPHANPRFIDGASCVVFLNPASVFGRPHAHVFRDFVFTWMIVIGIMGEG